MPEVVRGDVEIVREVLKRDGVALQHASEDLKVGPSSPADGVTFKGWKRMKLDHSDKCEWKEWLNNL